MNLTEGGSTLEGYSDSSLMRQPRVIEPNIVRGGSVFSRSWIETSTSQGARISDHRSQMQPVALVRLAAIDRQYHRSAAPRALPERPSQSRSSPGRSWRPAASLKSLRVQEFKGSFLLLRANFRTAFVTSVEVQVALGSLSSRSSPKTGRELGRCIPGKRGLGLAPFQQGFHSFFYE